jgi:hypothetical protein
MGKLKVIIEKKESQEELERILQNNQLMKLDETCNTYVYLEIEDTYIVGLAYYSLGIDIEYVVSGDNQYIYLGVGTKLVCIDFNKKEVVSCEKLSSAFLDLLKDDDDLYYIVVCELDLYVYMNNKLLWKTGFRDIVLDYELVDNKCIRIETDDGAEVVFNLRDGMLV